jgi:uncharacterized protein
MKIAIVGAGASGQATAHLPARRHDIAVFDANTVRVDTEHGTRHVDTGFIDPHYPNFERLPSCLRVPGQPSDVSVAVSDGGDFKYRRRLRARPVAMRAHLVTPSGAAAARRWS